MSLQSFLTLLRNVLTIFGGYLIGKAIFGTTIDNNILELLVGVALTVAGTVWSIFDKTVTVEKLQGAIRHIISTIGGILISSGKLDPAKLEAWLGIITVLVPIIYSFLSKTKTNLISSGTISADSLKNSVTK